MQDEQRFAQIKEGIFKEVYNFLSTKIKRGLRSIFLHLGYLSSIVFDLAYTASQKKGSSSLHSTVLTGFLSPTFALKYWNFQ